MKKIKTDVLIIIEHKVRELESACLLKYEFEKRGLSVIIDGIYPNKEILPKKYCASIIVLPWAYSDKDMKYIKCFLINSPNAVFLNLHHEQYSGQDDNNICLPHGESTKMYHVSWGKKFSSGLINSGCNKNTILEVGNIKLDFYKNELKDSFYKKDYLAEKYGISKNSSWVLFIANGYHLMSQWKLDSIAESDKLIYEKANASIKCRNDFLNFVDKYLSKKKDKVFIYRPHPVYAALDKQEKHVNELLKKYKNNFYVIEELSIGNWLVNCDICMSFHSTSAVECCLSNVPYYLFRTEALIPEQDYPFFKNYKYIITNYKEFENLLINQSYDNKVLKSALSEYFNLSSIYTFSRIVDGIIGKDPIYLDKPTIGMRLRNSFRSFVKQTLIFLSKMKIIKLLIKKKSDDRLMKIIENSTDNITNDDIIRVENIIKKCFDKEKQS